MKRWTFSEMSYYFTLNNECSFFNSGSNMTDMQCMLQKDPLTLLIAGHQDEIFELDLNRHKILKEVCFSLSFENQATGAFAQQINSESFYSQ